MASDFEQNSPQGVSLPQRSSQGGGGDNALESYVSLSLDEVRQFSLAGLELHHRFRAHKGFMPEEHLQIFRHELAGLVKKGGACWGLRGATEISAVCALAPLDWDSAHFGMPMGRLVLAAGPLVDKQGLVRFLAFALQAFRERSAIVHWSVEVDINDYRCLNALVAAGFEILDLKKIYGANRLRNDIDSLRMKSSVRSYRPADHDAVVALLAQSAFPSRFSRDATLDPEKVRSMYRAWFENLLGRHEGTAIVLVSERGGRVVACGGIDEFDFASLGLPKKMMSGGLYVSGPGGTGSYIPIMHHLTTLAIERYGTVETTISINNEAACRVLDSFRSYSGVVTRYALRLAT